MCWVLILSLWRSHDWRVPSAPHPHLLHPTKPHINEAPILIGLLLPILIGLFLHILIRFSFPILIRFSADLWRGTSARPELICWIKIKLSKSSQFLSLSLPYGFNIPQRSIFPTAWTILQVQIPYKFLSNKLWKIFLSVYEAVMHFAACLSGDYRSNSGPNTISATNITPTSFASADLADFLCTISKLGVPSVLFEWVSEWVRVLN